MPPTFLIYLFIYFFAVYVLPVLGIVFALGYGVYRWRQRPGRRVRAIAFDLAVLA